jgi:hypothetical protein
MDFTESCHYLTQYGHKQYPKNNSRVKVVAMRYSHRRFYRNNSMLLWGVFGFLGVVVTTVIQAGEDGIRGNSTMFLDHVPGDSAAYRLRNAAQDRAGTEPRNVWLIPNAVSASYDDGVYSVHLPSGGAPLTLSPQGLPSGDLDVSLGVGYRNAAQNQGLVGRQQRAFLNNGELDELRPQGATFYMSIGGRW